MIKWFKRNQDGATPPAAADAAPGEDVTVETSSADTGQMPVEQTEPGKPGFYARLKRGMSKTRHQLGESIGRLLLGRKEIDASLMEDIETLLLSADLGIDTSQTVLQQVSDSLARKQLADGAAVYGLLKERLTALLAAKSQPLIPETPDGTPFVILTVGVNGAGKTTTIGKLAKQFQQQGKKVMLAAGDTFRAAAVEQLQVWGNVTRFRLLPSIPARIAHQLFTMRCRQLKHAASIS